MFAPFALEGRVVVLERMLLDHAESLLEAASEDRSTYGFTHVPATLEEMALYIRTALDLLSKGRAIPFVVRRKDTGKIVGTTRLMDLEVIPLDYKPGVTQPTVPCDALPPNACEIGATWYASSAQRTAVNTECKLLLLTHAFEAWNAVRVMLKTDARNMRSRQAIERIGAQFEGIRRRHSPASDGGIRDAAFFSIIAEEWPNVREMLVNRLAR